MVDKEMATLRSLLFADNKSLQKTHCQFVIINSLLALKLAFGSGIKNEISGKKLSKLEKQRSCKTWKI